MRNDNLNDRNDEQMDQNDDQLRPNTMNEVIREASGNPDTNLNELQDTSTGATMGSTGSGSDAIHGVNYSPNDASGVHSGGTTDMDNQGGTGGGHSSLAAHGKFGSNLEPKHNVTGSDYDGQVSTS